jgi:hypothetical protein
MWNRYEVELKMTGHFAASLPRTREEIEKMLENRTPAKLPEDFISLEELADEIVEKVGIQEGEDELKYGWATFCRSDDGLYYEGRCVRGHIKDCALQVKGAIKPEIKALKAKVANKVYVMTDIIPLMVNGEQAKEPVGTVQRFIQVMTMKGPRSTMKFVDYVEKPTLTFQLNVLDDGVITEDILSAIFEYGSVHGMGQERSQGWGRYSYAIQKV